MTTKAGRINKGDIRQGKTFWEVRYTWSDMLRRFVPIIEAMYALDRPWNGAGYGEPEDKHRSYGFTVIMGSAFEQRSAFVRGFVKSFFAKRSRAVAWLKLHGASDLNRQNDSVVTQHFPTWTPDQIKTLQSRIAEGYDDQIRMAIAGKTFEQHEVELYVRNKERFHLRMLLSGHASPVPFDRNHIRRLALFAQQNNAPGYVQADPRTLEGRFGEFAKPYDPVPGDVKSQEALAEHLTGRDTDGQLLSSKPQGEVVMGRLKQEPADSPLLPVFTNNALIGMRGRMGADDKLDIDSFNLIDPGEELKPVVEVGELSKEDAAQGYSWPLKVTFPPPAGVESEAFNQAMARAQAAADSGNNPDVHLLKEGVKIPNQEQDDGDATSGNGV